MSLKAYRILTVAGLGGALTYLLVELAEDGLTERILPLSYRTAAEAEMVKAALERADADEAPPPRKVEPELLAWRTIG